MSSTWMTTRAWLLMLPLLVIMIAVIGWPASSVVAICSAERFLRTAFWLALAGASTRA